jgi:uncharacterized membrane protein
MPDFLETLVTSALDLPSIDGPTSNAALVAACSAALLTLLPVAAYQFGCLRHLPDPPGTVFESDRITESRAAHPLGIPDSLLGLGSYGVTLAFAVNARKSRKARKALMLKLLLDSAVAGFNVVRQVVLFRRLCSWCMGTALCTFAMVVSERATIRNQIAMMRGRIDFVGYEPRLASCGPLNSAFRISEQRKVALRPLTN